MTLRPSAAPERRPRLLSALLLALAPSALAGQASTALFDVSAYVPQGITTSAVQPLAFGKVPSATVKTVRFDDPQGRQGRWQVTGAACSEVNLSLVLPTALTGESGELAIGGWTADWKGGSPAQQSFSPSGSPTRARFDHAGAACGGGGAVWEENGSIVVRIGATVISMPQQLSGSYGATLTLQVAYVDF